MEQAQVGGENDTRSIFTRIRFQNISFALAVVRRDENSGSKGNHEEKVRIVGLRKVRGKPRRSLVEDSFLRIRNF
jgi:hypothetical protein